MVRKAEYDRRDRCFIKGQNYNLLSRQENLTVEGKRSLKILVAANRHFNTAHVLIHPRSIQIAFTTGPILVSLSLRLQIEVGRSVLSGRVANLATRAELVRRRHQPAT